MSVLTSVQLTRIFEQRVNFDLRRLLGGLALKHLLAYRTRILKYSLIGTEVFLDSLATLFNNDHSFMLSGLKCLRLSRTVRDQAGSILTEGKVKVIDACVLS